MLVLDLLIVHRRAKAIPFKQAAVWSAVWVGLALSFGAFVAWSRGGASAGEYIAGYLIELSLSVDNVFVFAVIFASFAVPAAYQHRLLFWGILGAIVFRAIFIAGGLALLDAAHWVIYLLGVILVVTGIRLAVSRGHAVAPEQNPVLRLFRRVVPMSDGYRGPALLVREGGRRLATPLLAVLVAIETTDIMFALDSIPAVFAVTTDPLIVFSSNLFAILGLRSLYFLLAGLMDRFVYLKLGLSALLVFAGAKILLSSVYQIPIALSLGVIVAILSTAVIASIVATHPRRHELREPLIRIASGIGLGMATLILAALGAAVRGGATWPGGLAVAALVVASTAAVVGGIIGLRRGSAPWLAAAGMRVGTGILLGTSMTAALACLVALRDRELGWMALDAAILGGVAIAVALGVVAMRRLGAQGTLRRASAMAAVGMLLTLALLIALD
jgi:tellurite resistance protein TerC